MQSKIKKAVNEIIRDLSNRKGLSDEWDGIDNDIKRAIKVTWINIIETELSRKS